MPSSSLNSQSDDALILERLAKLLDSGDSGAGLPETPTETLLFYFTGNAQLTYACQYDGVIRQAGGATNGNVGISVNTDLPSVVIQVQSVYSGQDVVIWPVGITGAQLYYVFHRFKTGDIIKVRNYNASSLAIQVLLQRNPIQSS